MLAFNHALTGSLLTTVMPLPLALPAAVASHFVLDAIPHYGIDPTKRNKTLSYKLIVYLDTFSALFYAGCAALLHKWSMEAGGWLAWSPDLMWVVYYFANGRNLHLQPSGRIMKFHARIQRESSWGIITELAMIAVLLPLAVEALLS